MSVKYADLKPILSDAIKGLGSEFETLEKIKNYVEKYEVPSHEIAKVFNNVDLLDTINIRFIALITEAIFEITHNNDLNPELYFSETEMKDARHYAGTDLKDEDEINLPFRVQGARKIKDSVYLITLTAKEINGLRKKVLYYNKETQRETTKRKQGDSFFEVPTLNPQSVADISKCLLEGTLYPSALIFNAAIRTSTSGNEIIYDEKTRELEITEGTRLDILDGYHRIMGIMKATMENKDIDMVFPVILTNYSLPNAKKYLAQISKANPISKARIEELSSEKWSATVIGELRLVSILKGKISQTEKINKTVGEIVSYSILAETIDEEFEMKNKADAMDASEYLTEFFDYLIGKYDDVFITNYDHNAKLSLMNHNIMFVAYVTLAARMFENKENVRQLKKYIEQINFSKDNPEWIEMKLLTNNTVNYRKPVKNKLKKYINKLYMNLNK